jgi:hypothetical protein
MEVEQWRELETECLKLRSLPALPWKVTPLRLDWHQKKYLHLGPRHLCPRLMAGPL